MNILATQYALDTQSLEIYVAGCKAQPHCKNCHNPESWSFDKGITYDSNYFDEIYKKVKRFDSMIKNIMIMGGEPLDQHLEELYDMLKNLNTLNKKLWLFTRYELNEVPKQIKNLCDYIKTGKYDETLKTNDYIDYGIKLATKNQKIHKVR